MPKIRVTDRIQLGSSIMLTDAATLQALRTRVAELIAIYGPQAAITFDTGGRPIREYVVVQRLETDQEQAAREGEDALLRERKKQKIRDQIEQLQRRLAEVDPPAPPVDPNSRGMDR